MHEMVGHNNNLNHAAVIVAGGAECSHCDWSSAMGYCCVQRCMSAPHNWQLGWASPITVLDGNSLLVGQTLQYNVPVQYSSDVNMLVVAADWANTTHTYFMSYRQQQAPYDVGMPGYFGGVNVSAGSLTTQSILEGLNCPHCRVVTMSACLCVCVCIDLHVSTLRVQEGIVWMADIP